MHIIEYNIILQRDEDAFTSLGTGNRIATVLFYVSIMDVYIVCNTYMYIIL